MRRPRLALALLLAIPATAAAGCGAASSVQNAVDPVARAAETTAGAGGAQMAMQMTMTAGGQTIPVAGSGVLDQTTHQGSFSMSVTVPGAGPMRIDEIVDGKVFYIHLPPGLPGGLPAGKSWIKIDLTALGKKAGIDIGALQESGAGQLSQYLGFLKAAGDARRVGTDTVRGVQTTHYAASIDFAKAGKALGGDAGKALQQVETSLGVASMPVDVWVDSQQLVRRLTATFSTRGVVPVSMSMTLDVLRYHVPVHVTAPPAGQVLDASALAGRLGT